MLIPRKVKYRKQHHPKRDGQATGGTVSYTHLTLPTNSEV